MAARIASEATAGEVLVSEETVSSVEDQQGIEFEPREPARLKGIAGPVPLYRARAASDVANR
jgi:class 3 adenylate cyclase